MINARQLDVLQLQGKIRLRLARVCVFCVFFSLFFPSVNSVID